ncbi:MAG: DUF4834 domain-containing protein [Porphyromonas sp.]|nr:DUF4834 domain-containing protein [Porphyromonas sp.]
MWSIPLIIFVLLPLYFIIRIYLRHQETIKKVYRLRKEQQAAAEREREERERRERVRRTTDPDQTTVERIQDTSVDLDGGEYVNYEEYHE